MTTEKLDTEEECQHSEVENEKDVSFSEEGEGDQNDDIDEFSRDSDEGDVDDDEVEDTEYEDDGEQERHRLDTGDER
jgi:hypothetical protein